ncbi:MAG: hypothetical protein AB7I37_25315 [Pirellulales bacterium]
MQRTIKRTNPKGQDITVSSDGRTYINDSFTLHFQEGPIPNHGVRNGAFEEELLAVLIDRAERAGQHELAAQLKQAMAILVPEPIDAT